LSEGQSGAGAPALAAVLKNLPLEGPDARTPTRCCGQRFLLPGGEG
jgi:hypothetical protein